jgi:tRNA dimethylallyltransferase
MSIDHPKLLVSIIGPTAVGKTACSIELAKHYKAEIVSADSRQIYKEMSIGTAKPSVSELSAVTHHFINRLSVEEDFNAFDFEKQAIDLILKLQKKHRVVFLTGGSGLYLHGIWFGFDELPGADKGYRSELKEILENQGIEALQTRLLNLDPTLHATIDLQNPARLIRALELNKLTNQLPSDIRTKTQVNRPFKILKIGLDLNRDDLYDRINKRVDKMIENGLIEEAEKLLPFKDKNALKTVGYQELFSYFRGDLTRAEAIEKIKVNSRRYAKRQMSWFRRYDDIHWYDPDETEKMIQMVDQNIKIHT